MKKYTVNIPVWGQLLVFLALTIATLCFAILSDNMFFCVVETCLACLFAIIFCETIVAVFVKKNDSYTESGRAFLHAIEMVTATDDVKEKITYMNSWKTLYGISNREFRKRMAWTPALQDLWGHYYLTTKPMKSSQEEFLTAVRRFYQN